MIGLIELSMYPYYRMPYRIVFGLNDDESKNQEEINKYLNNQYYFVNGNAILGKNTSFNTEMDGQEGSCWFTMCEKTSKIMRPHISFVSFDLTTKMLGCLTHEINHAVFWIFHKTDILANHENDEPFTYLSGRMVEVFLDKFINKKYKRIMI